MRAWLHLDGINYSIADVALNGVQVTVDQVGRWVFAFGEGEGRMECSSCSTLCCHASC
jgi:hypothetical protein